MVGAAADGAVTGLWFGDQRYFPSDADKWDENYSYPVLVRLGEWLDEYFKGKNPETDIPLAPQGTEFRQKVWNILLRIPYGQTTTYGEIARQIGTAENPARLARAVGGAVGHNPVSILIPCHRVIGSNRSLTGYAGGLDRKTALLKLEGLL
jgi:methylated-DNA-[protein]-cysteine S-methyltransferase